MAQSMKTGKGLNLNKASVEDLEKIGKIDRKRAQDIVNYRNQHGPFKSLEDLENVPGFTMKLIDVLKTRGIAIR
ncbi:MAG: helix-hairpin-helix domain-containing protein [Syntrophobacteraceae bacterium]|jgi:competence protein ComEA